MLSYINIHNENQDKAIAMSSASHAEWHLNLNEFIKDLHIILGIRIVIWHLDLGLQICRKC